MTIQEKILILNNAVYLLREKAALNMAQIHEQAKIAKIICGYAHFTKLISVKLNQETLKTNINAKKIKDNPTFQNVYEAVLKFVKQKLNIEFKEDRNVFMHLVTGEAFPLKTFQEVSDNNSWLLETNSNLDIKDVKELITQSEDIKILQTFFSSINDLDKTFRKALENENCRIKVLLFKPHTEILQLRSKGLGEENIFRALWDNIQYLVRLAKEFEKQIEFRLYNAIPGFTFYKGDNIYLLGFQWFDKYNRDGTYLKIDSNKQSSFTQDLEQHWQSLWDYSAPLRADSAEVKFSAQHKPFVYKAYFQFANEIQTAQLNINPTSYDLLLSRTQSKLLYFGSIVDLGNNCVNIILRHELDVWNRHIGNHIIMGIAHTQLEAIGTNELILGMRIINHPFYQNITHSKFLLVNEDTSFVSTDISEEEKMEMIAKFFSTPVLVEGMRITWRDLKQFYDTQKY